MNHKLFISVALMILFIGCTEPAQEDACELFNKVDKEMLDTYDLVVSEYNTDERFLLKLNMAQVYWIQYRDRHLEALYPKKRKEYQEGDWDNFVECECEEMIRLTKERIKTLRVWLDGSTLYDDCPTSLSK